MRTNRSAGLSFSLALMAGVVAGALTSSTGCIIPDVCIAVVSKGYDWCSKADGALMWPAGEPELAEPVLFDGKPPLACRCFNSAEDEILWAEVPAETFEEFRANIELAARNECDSIVPAGWDHNCYIEGPDGLTFPPPYPQDGPGDCVGSCSYAGKDCGTPPNPYECEELYGVGETGGTSGVDPDDLDGVERPIAPPQEDL